MGAKPSCQECRFWAYFGEGETDIGECRRHAPQPFDETREEAAAGPSSIVWPSTRASDWCGEHEQLEGAS